MVLFCAGFFLQFFSFYFFFSHVQVISPAISLVCRLKYPNSCFSFLCCFLDPQFVVLLFVFILIRFILLLLSAVTSLSLLFFELLLL